VRGNGERTRKPTRKKGEDIEEAFMDLNTVNGHEAITGNVQRLSHNGSHTALNTARERYHILLSDPDRWVKNIRIDFQGGRVDGQLRKSYTDNLT
jgi:hypothetical protein